MQLKLIKDKFNNIFVGNSGKNNNMESKNAASYLKNIINNVPNFLVWKDVNSVFLGCNKQFADSLGLESPQDIVGKTDYDFPWTDEQREAYLADEREIIRTGKPKLDYEEKQTLPDGSVRINLVSKVPMYDEGNKISGVLMIFTDITDRKHLEENLKKAKEKSERAYKAKSEFIRNITHDIRTPLSGIQQTARMISEGKVSEEEVPEYAFATWEASNKLMELFNQVIDVSKKEAFDFEDRIVKFDLYKLLQNLNKTYAIVAKHKKLKLEVEHSDQVPHYLLGKHLRLHRILMNLLGNALKFTEQGNVRLVVEKAQEADEKVVLRFSVIDTGIGIAEDKQEDIFEPFSRLNPSFQNQYPGSGLGLHVVKDYINKMQGEIYVESEEGHGSMFTCILPFKRPLLDNDNDVVETDYEEDLVQPTISTPVLASIKKDKNNVSKPKNLTAKYHVLLVEDDKLMQTVGLSLLKEMLEYQVDLARTGEEALELTSKNTYDLIYMDIGLGTGIDGIETVRQIRDNPQNLSNHAFISALTAHADEEITKQCLEVSMQQVLIKPLNPEKIQQTHTQLAKPQDFSEDQEVIDWTLWLTRLSQNKELAEQSFHLMGGDMLNNRQTIVEAYESQDFPKLKAITHKMKGALGYCGLPRLETAMRAIESAAKDNNAEGVNKWYKETLDALDEARIAYEKWATTHPKQN